MARRKARILDDGTDSDESDQSGSEEAFDSQDDEDSRAERRLFEHRRKRQRRLGGSGKAAAWEGVFGEDDNAQFKSTIKSRKGGRSTDNRTDWTKAPAFVPSDTHQGKAQDEKDTVLDDGTSLSVSDSASIQSDGDDRDTRPASPRVDDHDVEQGTSSRPGLGGLGFRSATSFHTDSGTTAASETPLPSFVNRFATAKQGSQTELRTNFQPSRSTTPTSVPAPLTRAEKNHFSSISSSFGAKLLAKQGWTPGKGLGLNEDGRAVPVAVGKMARGEGIKSGIRTEDSKREARRKGELVEEEETKTGKQRGPRQERPQPHSNDGWKRHRKAKVPKVEHKTYEQLISEEGIDSTKPGVGLVLDARGGEIKTLDSIADLSLSQWTPTSEVIQLPELRHNLRLIVDVSKGDVGHLVREGKTINERRRWSLRDQEGVTRKAELSAQTVDQLRNVQLSVQSVIEASKQQVASGATSLENLGRPFENLLRESKGEYIGLGLDEIIVGSIDLVLRTTFAQWQPFSVSSDALLSTLKPWKRAFNLNADDTPASSEREMTAWESMLWNRWLPKVRSVINNEWDVSDPHPAVHLVESWDPILPRFIHDNIMDQLILPKVNAAVETWDGRRNLQLKQTSLAATIFPWLPILGSRGLPIVEQGKRRIRAVLRKWTPGDGVLVELKHWRQDIFTTQEWDKLMGEFVLGKLGTALRDNLQINPRKQDLQPLVEWVLPWHTLIRASNFIRLLELEFFPKWLDVLYLWLVHPGYNAEEIAQWFEMWKSLFPKELLDHRAMAKGFSVGLNLMSTALDLGVEAPAKLQRPAYSPQRDASDALPPAKQSKATVKPLVAPAEDITFRSLLEDAIAAQDLIMVPLGKSHAVTGKPLFRIGSSIDGKGGVTVYVGSDAVFAQGEGGDFRAVSLGDLLSRAKM